MRWNNYEGKHFGYKADSPVKRRYSITADVLSYQRCPQQYSLYKIRKYESSMTNQLFYGTVIHQVLDRAHMHYKGILDPSTAGKLPTDEDIASYFQEVDIALRARHITAGEKVKDQALEIIKRFNSIEGPNLYPRVVNTECRLMTDKAAYILHGNVDVLATSPQNPNTVEIWDYKGTNRPSQGDPQYQQYIYQMQVYADLYRKQTGIMPQKAILYFLNHLSGEPSPSSTPRNAMLEVTLDSAAVDTAIENFSNTVSEIENSRLSGTWASPAQIPPKETCDICDLRWRCAFVAQHYPMRHP